MSKSENGPREGLRALLVRDHQELERLFQSLLDALQALGVGVDRHQISERG